MHGRIKDSRVGARLFEQVIPIYICRPRWLGAFL